MAASELSTESISSKSPIISWMKPFSKISIWYPNIDNKIEKKCEAIQKICKNASNESSKTKP